MELFWSVLSPAKRNIYACVKPATLCSASACLIYLRQPETESSTKTNWTGIIAPRVAFIPNRHALGTHIKFHHHAETTPDVVTLHRLGASLCRVWSSFKGLGTTDFELGALSLLFCLRFFISDGVPIEGFPEIAWSCCQLEWTWLDTFWSVNTFWVCVMP